MKFEFNWPSGFRGEQGGQSRGLPDWVCDLPGWVHGHYEPVIGHQR